MKTIFTKQEDTAAFLKQGYVRKSLLNTQQVAELSKLYSHYFPKGTDKFFSSTFLQDVSLKEKISEQLCELLLPAIAPYFENYKVLGAQFLIKNPGEQGKMPYHQDWTIVDEEKTRSLTVWIGLDDIGSENGAIKVIPGSHEFSRDLRGPGNFDALAEIQDLLGASASTLSMNSGEAFIFDHSVIHGSGVNLTNKPRRAVALGLVHKEAPLVFYHKKDESHFEQYEVPGNFFITFPNDGKAPEGARLKATLPYAFKKYSPGYFKNKMKSFSTSTSPAIKPLFKDADLQQAFEKDGYVKINLLSEMEANELKAYYLSLDHDHIGDYGFHISLENTNADYITGVFKKLFDATLPKLDQYLDDYKAFTSSYVIKEAGLQNIVPPHQDWTFVDEEQFCSATVWIPLMDVNKNNGALGVIKGSHRIFNYPRASPSPQAKSLLSDHAFNLFPYVEVIDMKAGEALIFNNKTVHASPPNISGITRIAAGIGITSKNAALRHYYQLPGAEQTIEVYEVNESFFQDHNNSKMSDLFNKGEAPDLKKIDSFKKNTPEFSKKEITEMISSYEGVTLNKALMEELAGLYNYNSDGTPKKSAVKPVQSTNSPGLQPAAVADTRTFFQKYTPANIVAELKHRFKKN